MLARDDCPGPADLQGLLDGTLAPDAEARLSDHLGECARCQQQLEALAAGAGHDVQAYLHERPSDTLPADLHHALVDLTAPPAPRPGADRGEDLLLRALTPANGEEGLGWLGPYRVTEILGRGAFGVVLKAFDPALHRYVALKVLAPQLASSAAARLRFAREARAAAAVRHENVVGIYGVDEANGLPYLVMEYVAGLSLQQRLDLVGPLRLEEVLRIGLQTACGLAAAHAQGLIHRDVKPANILLENGIERVKVTDFGLARAADDASLTQSGVIAGTPQYMSPEQARGEPLDHRADLFSLGSVLYALCTGRAPFRAGTTLAVLRRICEETPRPVNQVNPDVPAWLAEVVALLQAKEPAERLQSAAQVAELLEQFLAQRRQPWRREKPPPLPRRRRTTLATARRVVTAAFCIAAGVGALGLAYRIGLAGHLQRQQAHEAELAQVRRQTESALQAARAGRELGSAGGPFLGAAFSRDGKLLALACSSGVVEIREWPSRRLLWVLPHEARVWSVAFSVDSRWLVSAAGEWDGNDIGEVRL